MTFIKHRAAGAFDLRTDPTDMADIILPTDFSDPSLNAAAYALKLVGGRGNTFHLLHSYLEPVPANAAFSGASDVMYQVSVEGMERFKERFLRLAGANEVSVETHVRYGPLPPVVADLCREKKATLVVMGTQGATGLTLLGSNAAAVARDSTTPVLVIPKDARFEGLGRALFADDHVSVDPGAMGLLVDLLQKHGASLLLAHVSKKKEDEPDPAIIEDYRQVLAGVKHEHVGALSDDVAGSMSEIAERNEVDMIVVLHRHLGLLSSLFHRSLAKQLALHTTLPLLVLEHKER